MAREEHEREDFLRDAVALVERCELELADRRVVIVGFRADGCASIYIDGDPAWHFNTAGQLRRAYVDGFLYKVEHARLVRLQRQRSATAVELVRHECTQEETAALLQRLTNGLTSLAELLATVQYRLIGQVPENASVVRRACDWLSKMPQTISLAATPRAG